MDFSTRRLDGDRVRCFEGGESSPVQMLFVPGPFNPEIWKHQLRYFSKNYTTLCYQTEDKDFDSEKRVLEKVLDLPRVQNAVLVSAGPGNAVIQSVEDHDSVVATVMTGARERPQPRVPESLYNAVWRALEQPKIAKKMLFSDQTRYPIVKRFLDDLVVPGYDVLRSFEDSYRMVKPVKNSLLVHADSDRFSSKEFAKTLKPNIYLSVIRGAGTFSFYEKPEEYNKAVLDFLNRLEGFVESRNVRKAQKKNRSLREFETRRKAVMHR